MCVCVCVDVLCVCVRVCVCVCASVFRFYRLWLLLPGSYHCSFFIFLPAWQPASLLPWVDWLIDEEEEEEEEEEKEEEEEEE